MGYYVSSALSVSLSDSHSFFVYYVPADENFMRMSTSWIDDWVHENFSKIAGMLGPNGVIVAPSPKKRWEDGSFNEFHCLFDEYTDYDDNFLYIKSPFLLISTSPIRRENVVEVERNGIAINLASCADEKELSEVIDILIDGIKDNNLEYIVEKFPKQNSCKAPTEGGSGFHALNNMVELKPNIFGLGVNLNAILEMAFEKFRR
ncbi:TPA: hypothetical protein I7673_22595 [Vibrio vulnificus]|nr:hypothetical protein [Vibrio vulnificus]